MDALSESPDSGAHVQKKKTAADYGLNKPAYTMPEFLSLLNRGRTTGYYMKKNGLPTVDINGSDYITTPTIVDLLNGDLVLKSKEAA